MAKPTAKMTATNGETISDNTDNVPAKSSNTSSEMNKTNNFQRIAQKKMLVRGYSRAKKIEKLADYSSCKVGF